MIYKYHRIVYQGCYSWLRTNKKKKFFSLEIKYTLTQTKYVYFFYINIFHIYLRYFI